MVTLYVVLALLEKIFRQLNMVFKKEILYLPYENWMFQTYICFTQGYFAHISLKLAA